MEIVVTAQNSGRSARVTGATEALKIDSNRKMKAPNYNKISIMAAGLGLAFFVMPDAQAQTATQRGKNTAPKKTSASNNSSTRQAVRGSRPATGGTSGSTSRPVDPQSGQRDPNAGRPGGASYPNSGQTGSPTSGPSIQGQGGPKQGTTQPTSGPSIQGQGGPKQSTTQPTSGPSIQGQGGPKQSTTQPTSGPSIQGQGGPKQSTTQPTSGPSIQGQGGPAQTKDPFSGGGNPSIQGQGGPAQTKDPFSGGGSPSIEGKQPR